MEKGNQLYEACVGYLVSEKSEANSWEQMCRFLQELQNKGTTIIDMKVALKAVEAQVKQDFKVKSMPSAWRSAKSVAMKAMDKGLAFVDNTGAVLGKSAVEAGIKALSSAPNKSKPAQLANTHLLKAKILIDTNPMTDVELTVIGALVSSLDTAVSAKRLSPSSVVAAAHA